MIAIMGLALLSGVVPVQVRAVGDGFELVREGKPYYIRGAGGSSRLPELLEAGGNSIRTWGADQAGLALSQAQKLGLTCTVGIWLKHKDELDYSDKVQVQRQFEAAKADILKLRNEPSLLVCGLGNEMEHDNDTPELWQAVEALHKVAHEYDPNHPTMTVVAEVSQAKIDNIKKYAPDIDILGVNSYGGAPSLAKRLREYGWNKPYMVTELGPLGPWEVGKTPWGAAFEQTSTEKAAWYRKSFEANEVPNCLGTYAFIWGNKQEETPTWFGMFLASGEATEAIDTMNDLWKGKRRANRAPTISAFKTDVMGKQIAAGSMGHASVEASDPDGDRLTYRWSLRREASAKSFAGSGEVTPKEVELHQTGPEIEFNMPATPGAYRLYLTILDGKGCAATANAPFMLVE
jgi:hypothetical protein